MVYKERFVAVVKCGGKILREKDGFVYLPFGSEYSLLLKNLESRKASVNISIDGQDVMNGRSLLLNPNTSIDLERFIESLERGNKFKFIQKTKEISEHRGDRIDDGIIRVEFSFEAVTRHINVIEHHDHYDHHHRYNGYWYPYRCVPTWGGSSGTITSNSVNVNFTNSSFSSYKGVEPLQEEGITVRGSESNQNFSNGSVGTLDPSEVIILRLRGEGSVGCSVKKPLTVKSKIVCETCGKELSSLHSFCSNCGTAIRVV